MIESINESINVAESFHDKDKESCSYDEAVELSGHGWYSFRVLLACCVITNAAALDMFGFSIVAAAASCDLELSLTKTGILASAPLIGVLFACPWGYYADTCGRKRALLLSTSVGFVFAASTSIAPTWQIMLAVKILASSFTVASITLCMTYLGECVGSKHVNQYLYVVNGMNLASEFVSFGLAYIFLPLDFQIPVPWLSITFSSWRLFTLVMALPLGFGAFMLIFLQESPKFLANIMKVDEALEVLKKMYLSNGNQGEYPVKCLKVDNSKNSHESFWSSLLQQTLPLFKPPLLWNTVALYYLMTICCSTNNVFLMWYPAMVNMFFNYLSNATEDDMDKYGLCARITSSIVNNTDTLLKELPCDGTISMKTIYSGIIYGLFFCCLTLLVSRVAAYRRTVLICTFIIAGGSGILTNLMQEPIANMIFFVLLQGTSLGIGSVASYCTDLYPTSYRGMAISLSMMVARMVSFGGVNLVGAVITNYCELTFYCWSIFVFSGVGVALFLPKGKT